MRGSVLTLIAIVGCSNASPSGPASVVDAASDIDEAAIDVVDVTDVVDVADAMADVARDVRDVSDASDVGDGDDASDVDDAPADVVIDVGMCGASVRTCLCDCGGTNAVCVNSCVGANIDCGACVYTAATRCCPDESLLFDMCIDRNMCADNGCIMLRCAMEQQRFNSCFASAQMSVEACRGELRTCLGSDYPMIQCVRL